MKGRPPHLFCGSSSQRHGSVLDVCLVFLEGQWKKDGHVGVSMSVCVYP